ncbi:hypothetical protein [Nonomuraea sediminis]|uniref:hypothetical protein n=1 Tax=Nonomuraea sediminis TaxID=2835864 RepID=UPI001BDCFF73|nr:hypothetical protein [Nonomuraea sediminis]
MSVTLAGLQGVYGRHWEIFCSLGRWYAVQFCWRKCRDPLHGSRHILLAGSLEALAARLERTAR